jgi:CheY-like chemotaxis protein
VTCETISAMTTVLIVDDHPSFRRFARALLQAAGFSVVDEAADGASALAAVQRLRPDVVLLDVLLPDTTGFEVAAALASEPAGPVVVLTSSRSAADLGASLEGSQLRFVAKGDLSGPSFSAALAGAA